MAYPLRLDLVSSTPYASKAMVMRSSTVVRAEGELRIGPKGFHPLVCAQTLWGDASTYAGVADL